MAISPPTRSQNVSPDTLSALRDDLLPPATVRALRDHIPACAACQRHLNRFDAVARALRGQPALEPGDRVLRGVRAHVGRKGVHDMTATRTLVLGGLGAAAAAAAVVILAISLLHGGPGRGVGPTATVTAPISISPTSTSGATPAPSVTATLAPGALIVADPAIARQLSFAFIQGNEVWVSPHSAAPRQVTHLGLRSLQLARIIWAPDQSRLLDVGNDTSHPSNPADQGWIVTLPSGAVTPLPASAAAVAGGCLANCAWMTDRYLVYISTGASHFSNYAIYDTQASRILTTALTAARAVELEVRGTDAYFVDYTASEGPRIGPGVVDRYSLGDNTITQAYTLPAPLVAQGIPSGNFDLSADGTRIVETSEIGASAHCPPGTGICYNYYATASGTVSPAFAVFQTQGMPVAIAPDGTQIAAIYASDTRTQIVQRAMPSGAELTNALPLLDAGDDLLGWTSQEPGVVVQNTVRDNQGNPSAAEVYYAPTGGSAPARLVETINVPSVVFAPPSI